MEINIDYENKEITFHECTLEDLALSLVYDFPEEEFGEFKILIA